jgi:hypothetical protein
VRGVDTRSLVQRCVRGRQARGAACASRAHRAVRTPCPRLRRAAARAGGGANGPCEGGLTLTPSCGRAGTVEDNILSLQERKRAMAESALGSGDGGVSAAAGRLTMQDLQFLFSGM